MNIIQENNSLVGDISPVTLPKKTFSGEKISGSSSPPKSPNRRSSQYKLNSPSSTRLPRKRREKIPTTPAAKPNHPAFMGDILEDIFFFDTPGVKAREDILLEKVLTPIMAFEEMKAIRKNPALFMMFYEDAKEHKVLESLHFILEVEEFLALPLDFRVNREKEIIENYLSFRAKDEINIPEAARKCINDKVGKKHEDIFHEAQKYVIHMLIRNVDSTWNYKKTPPPKTMIMKDRDLKKYLEKITDEQRIRDLINYFISGRITPLMYQARTSVVSLQRKVKTSTPTGWAIFKIKTLNLFKITSPIAIYFVGQSYIEFNHQTIRDKTSLVRTIPKKRIRRMDSG